MRPTPIAPAGPFVDDPSDEDYARAAQWALPRGDHRLAFEQASAAVVASRGKPEHVSLLDRVIASTPRPLEALRPGAGDVFYGIIAAYARALARAGRVDDAIEHLFLAAAYEPEQPLAAWALPWTSAPKEARKVKVETMARALARLSDAARARAPSLPLDANLEAAVEVGAQVRARHPEHPPLLAACASLLRERGELERAEVLLAASETPAWEVLVERAAVASARGDAQARRAHLERAAQLRPDDPATQLDLADAQLACGELPAARAAAAAAAALSSEAPPAAQALSAYLSRLAAGSLDARDEALAAAPELALDLEAYHARLVDPIDPLIGVIRGALARASQAGERELRVRARADGPLCPSARRAFELGLERAGRVGALEVRCDREGRFPELAPDAPLPGEPLRAALASIASSRFELTDWWRQAGALAPTAASAEEGVLLAFAARAPIAPPAGWDPCVWVQATQIAALLVVAALAPDDAAAQRALEPIARATDDWLAIAALLALRARLGADGVATLALELAPGARDPLHVASRALCQVGPSAHPALLRLRHRLRRERETR